ncbi:MAG: hypothetical protein WC554_08940 [Clostridia bacterium]
MNLITHELRKSFLNRSAIIFLVCLLAINMLAVYISERIDFGFDADIRSIRKLDQLLMGMDKTQAEKYLNEQIIIQNIAIMDRQDIIGIFKTEYPDYDINKLVERYRQGDYDKYTDIAYRDLSLFRQKLLEVESAYSYDEYIQSVINRAEQLKKSSIFSDTPFTIRNASKTYDDFNSLDIKMVRFNSSKGVLCATRNGITPILLWVFGIFVCIQTFTKDRDSHNLELLRTMKRGRKQLMTSKLISMYYFVSVSVTVTVLSSYVISYLLYGFGDISMPLQSVYGFRSSIYEISVGGYLVLYILLFVAVMIFLSSVNLLIFVTISNSLKGIVGILLVMGTAYILNKGISSVSFFNVFKYINAYHFLDVSRALIEYLNINILNYPVSYLLLFLITICVGTFAAFYICIHISKKKKERTYASSGILLKARKRKVPVAGIFWYEVYKSMVINPVIIILLVFCIIQIATVHPREPSEILNKKEFIYMKYMEVLEGSISDTKSVFLKENLIEIKKKQKEDTYNSYTDQIEVIMSLIAKDDRLHNLYDVANDQTIRRNISFIYERGYKEIFTDGTTTRFTALYASVLIVLCISGIFAVEIKNNTYEVITYTVYGRKRTFWYKQIITLIISLIVLITVYLPYIIKFSKESGFACLDAPIACMEDFALLPLEISVLEYFIWLFAVKFIGLIVMATFINLVSHYTGEPIVTASISLAAFVLPAFLSFSGIREMSDILMNVFLYGNRLATLSLALTIQSIVLVIACIVCFIILYIKFNKVIIIKNRKHSS